MLMVCSGENPAGWINLEEEENKKKILLIHSIIFVHIVVTTLLSHLVLCVSWMSLYRL